MDIFIKVLRKIVHNLLTKKTLKNNARLFGT